MWLISQTLPVQAGCICNTAWSRSADRGLHTQGTEGNMRPGLTSSPYR